MIISFLKKALENRAKAKAGKAYYDSLISESIFQYTTVDGNVVTAKKISAGLGKEKCAVCEVVAGLPIVKSAKRYPKFSQVIIPA